MSKSRVCALVQEHVEDFIEESDDTTVAVIVMVDGSGAYTVFPAVASGALEEDIYLACGLLDQAKMDLLASVPINRPLREPEPLDSDLATPPSEPPPKPKEEIN